MLARYILRKIGDCWIIFNLESGLGRTLTEDEVEALSKVYPGLTDPNRRLYYLWTARFLQDAP
ncbi:MAG: hypothetical protein Q8927_19290 [Bacteroidota bacterium]|nr:hypothetical protein [Bacteroidota bacterium]